MTFFKNLKSIFVHQDPNADSATTIEPSVKTGPSLSGPSPIPTTNTFVTPTYSSGNPDEKYTNILLEALGAQNIDGFDYMEFRQSVKSLVKMTMDEATRYQSAFAVAQTMGATTNKILESAKHYLDVLNAENAKFNESLAIQKKKQIADRANEKLNIEGSVKQMESQIAELAKRIAEEKTKLQSIQEAVGKAETKISETSGAFKASYEFIQTEIQGDINKIKQYLK